MSRENVETAHRFTEALVRGDYAAAAHDLGPNVEIDDTDTPESTGADSFRDWMAGGMRVARTGVSRISRSAPWE